MIDESDIFQQAGDLDDVAVPAQSTKLFGHGDAAQFLTAAANAKTLHHGLLIQGEHGIGKATLVYHFANWLLSGNGARELGPPDIESASWRQIVQNAHPNVLRISRPRNDAGTGFKTVVTIDEIRRVHRFLSLSAGADLPRLIIVDAANEMNQSAANALLKMLEEPPQNTHFFLIAHGARGILPTIRSRTQLLRLNPLSDQDLMAALAHVQPSLASNSSNSLFDLAGGSVRRAITMGLFGGDDIDKALAACLGGDPFDVATAHKLADIGAARGADVQRGLIYELLMSRLRNEARLRSEAGRLDDAAKLARLDADLLKRRRTAEGYNLDVRQELLVVLAQVHSTFRALAA